MAISRPDRAEKPRVTLRRRFLLTWAMSRLERRKPNRIGGAKESPIKNSLVPKRPIVARDAKENRIPMVKNALRVARVLGPGKC